MSEVPEDHRVEFDFEIDFSNGGGIQGQGFRLDIEGSDIADDELAAYIVRDMRLLMVGAVRILNKRVIKERHKRGAALEPGSGAPTRPVYRITTFVPPEHVDALLQGIEREAPLVFGRYDRSAWWSAVGIEQFRPLPGSSPTVGEAGRVERVPTVRVEFAIPRNPQLLERVIARGVIDNHPWDEPAVFVDESLATATMMCEPGPR